ncbi:MAG: hypothetical protein HZB23_10700 [Deltaproteobacteria bacterium]|nr:hypothetical protein [Deltaproteobacteria bacterium]
MSAQSAYLEALKRTPQYQRAVARLIAKAPQNAPMVSTAGIDAGLAGLAAKNMTQDFATASKEKNAATGLGLQKEALANKVWEAGALKSFREDQAGKTAGLGAAQVGISGLMGLAKLREDGQTKDQLDELSEFIKKRGSMGLGVGNG